MKQVFLLIFPLLFSSNVFAGEELTCVIQELENEESALQVIKVPVTESAHGSIVNFKSEKITGINGMVALMKGKAVISFYDESTKVGSSSFAFVVPGEVVHHQMLLPTNDIKAKAITADCKL